VKIIVYTGDVEVTGAQILSKARKIFNKNIDSKLVEFVFLNKRKWVEAEKYPRFTLLGQSLGSVVLAIEALLKFQPDIFIDTMGYAFTYPIFYYLGGCRVGCYVHYPTISTDMLRRVQNRTLAHNNQAYVAKNPFLTWLKLFYYKLFARIYGKFGRCADTVMVNSSWTENHILKIWNDPYKIHRVFPPCETSNLTQLQSTASDEKIVILSVGQYRPEKDHPLQLQAMYELRTLLNNDESLWNKVSIEMNFGVNKTFIMIFFIIR
jgi:alpha-1,2-mannosyltransferase